MFKWIERLRCNHEWELINKGDKGHIRLYVCKRCGKLLTSDSYDKDPVNKYVFVVSDKNDISNGSFTFNELFDREAVLLRAISKLHPGFFRKHTIDKCGAELTDHFLLTFKYDKNYYDAYTFKLSKCYFHLFEHVELDNGAYQSGYNSVSFTYAINCMADKINQGVDLREFYEPKYGSELCEKFEPVVQAVNNYLTPDAARQIVKEELNRLYGAEKCEAPIDTDTAVARVKGITTDIAGNLTLTAEAIREISAGVSKIGSFAPEAFYKKEGEESPHLNVCRESTDEEGWDDYPED